LPFSSKSHRNVFLPLATALVKRGHKVTMLCNHPPPKETNGIKFLQHALPYFNTESDNMFKSIAGNAMFDHFKTIFPLIGKEFYDDPVVKGLWAKRNTFDLFIVDALFNEVTYLFAHNKPLIIQSPGGIDTGLSASMGNLQNPAYAPSFIEFFPLPMSFKDRAKSLVMSVLGPMFFKGATRDAAQPEIAKRFPNMPKLVDFERRVDFNFINSHFSFGTVLPLLPNQIEVGGMHLRPPKPLPKDLEAFVSGSTPVIYFSLGSIAKSKDMDPAWIKSILEAFGRLPYKVLWKYEEKFEGLPDNVLVQSWMPQIDILAHPNVKLFITHCGMLSTQESIYTGKPMLGLPIFGDQPKNAETMRELGYGRFITWDQLSADLLVSEVTELVSNPSYGKKCAEMSKYFNDQPMSPTDRAVYWTEYALRHKGSRHLRSPETDLSWIEVLHLDILACILLLVMAIVKLVRKLFQICFGKKSGKTKKE